PRNRRRRTLILPAHEPGNAVTASHAGPFERPMVRQRARPRASPGRRAAGACAHQPRFTRSTLRELSGFWKPLVLLGWRSPEPIDAIDHAPVDVDLAAADVAGEERDVETGIDLSPQPLVHPLRVVFVVPDRKKSSGTAQGTRVGVGIEAGYVGDVVP